jgi:hypothetical protein
MKEEQFDVEPGSAADKTSGRRWASLQMVFVAGQAKSGSTIIDRLLSTQVGFMGLGEVDHIVLDEKLHHERAKIYGEIENLPCSCGVALKECDLWSPIAARILDGSLDGHTARYSAVVNRALELLLREEIWKDGDLISLFLVDSSKEPEALRRALGAVKEMKQVDVNLSVVIAYRDPRDWLVSDDLKEIRRGRKRGFRVRRRRLRKWLDRYRQLLSEVRRSGIPFKVVDLAHIQQDPESALNRIFSFLGVPREQLGPLDLSVANSHIVWGSHHRLEVQSAHSVWKSTHLRRADIWLLPWIFTPSVWPTASAVREFTKLSRS